MRSFWTTNTRRIWTDLAAQILLSFLDVPYENSHSSFYLRYMHSSNCKVDVLNRQRDVAFSVDPSIISSIVSAVLDNESQKADFVSIHFISDAVMRRYHKKFFQDPSSTDCMSFPLDISPDQTSFRHLGDVFVCPKTALSYAQGDEAIFWKELSLYIIHGLLHLLGYDDTEPKSKACMRRRERSAFSLLKKRALTLHGHLSCPILCNK